MGEGLKRARAAAFATRRPNLTAKQREIIDRLPRRFDQAVFDAIEAVLWVLRYEPSGGFLHCEISDGNLESLPEVEATSPYTGERFSREKRQRYERCVEALWKPSLAGREFACHVANGHDYCEWIDDHEKFTGDEFEEWELLP